MNGKSSCSAPVRRAKRDASAGVMGIVVSRQQAEHLIECTGVGAPMQGAQCTRLLQEGVSSRGFTGD